MNVIYSNYDFTIYQDNYKTTLFTITNTNTTNPTNANLFEPLINSVIRTKLTNYSTIIKQENGTKLLVFKAVSLESFEDFKKKYYQLNNTNKLSYELILNIIYSLSKQIHYLLEYESMCFYKLDTSNIYVINDSIFIYLSYDDLKEVKEKQIHIYRPISKSMGFLSPELTNAISIPILVNYKTIFYSLGLLIMETINNETFCIKGTKLDHFLMRCLRDKPENRFLLYV
jgi:hypothetical protein